MIHLDRSECGFPGTDQQRCGDPPIGVVQVRLPAEPVPGVLIAEDQREIEMGICGWHREIAVDQGMVFGSGPSIDISRFGPLADVIPDGHAAHAAPVTACLGCDIDFGPAHTRVPHG